MSRMATRGEVALPIRLAISLLVLLALVASITLVVWSATSVSGTRLTAVFTRSGQGLDPNSPVKVRGITVGGISSVTLNQQGRSVVSIYVDPGVRVPETVTATIEPSSVFGPKFVNLVPGDGETRGPYLLSGAVITRTLAPIDLSDSLSSAYEGLRVIDPQDVTTIVHTLGRGLDGKGPQLKEIVENSGKVFEVAHRRRAEFRRFIGDIGDLSTALGDKGDELVAISADTNAIMPDLLERADKARALLKEFDDVSHLFAHGLREHRRDLKSTVNSGESVASLFYSQLGLTGDGVRGLNRLLAVLNDLASGPGPNGKAQIKMETFISTDPCQLFLGACGPTNGG